MGVGIIIGAVNREHSILSSLGGPVQQIIIQAPENATNGAQKELKVKTPIVASTVC
jgi:hypothetical protein